MTHRQKFSRPLRLGASLMAAVVLAGCAGGSADHATMLRTPGYGQTEVAPIAGATRRVDLVAVTAQTIDQFANPAAANGAYLLGTGDVMQIFVVDEPELTLDAGYRVDASGTIMVPYLGSVPVANRSVEMIRADLATRLTQYRTAPQVEVRITDFNARHIAVVGEVRQPNRQTLTDQPLTAIDAINAAGGFADDPARASVTLIRAGVEQPVDVQAFLTRGQAMPDLLDGDVLRVEQSRGFRRSAPVQPAVQTAMLHRNGRAETLSLAGGPVSVAHVAASLPATPGAAFFVLRASTSGIQSYQLAAQDAVNPLIGGRFTLQPGDMVTFEPHPSTDANQLVAQLSPALRLMDQN